MPANYYAPKPLKEALLVPKTIIEHNAGYDIYRLRLAEFMSLKPSGDIFIDLLTASQRYGLTKGNYKSEKIELTDRARSIVEENPEEILNLLFENRFFEVVHSRYANHQLPPENGIVDWLKENKVGANFALGVCRMIIQDMRDWMLINRNGAKEFVVPREMALQKLQALVRSGVSSDGIEPGISPEQEAAVGVKEQDASLAEALPKPNSASFNGKHAEIAASTVTRPLPAPTPSVSVSPKVQLNIEIHIAADTPHETIEKIFESMGKHVMNNAARDA